MTTKVLKISCNEWNNFSRDKRELSLYRECGADISVMAKGGQGDKGRLEDVESFAVYRYSTRPLKGFVPIPVNRFIALFTWAFYASKFQADIISGHDITGLFIGWLSSLMQSKRKKPKLIYDAHEFEIGRTAKRSKFQVFLIKHLERFLMKRSAFSIMVNDSIADEVQRIHKLKERPIVVRNVPHFWKLEAKEITKNREILRDKMMVNPEAFIVSYHGAIVPGRGIETLLVAVSKIEALQVLILGNGSESYIKELQNLAGSLSLGRRVVFLPAVPIDELVNYLVAVDISYVLINAVSKSYYLSLPNKLFESVQALVPVIASDFPEIGKLVRAYDIGVAVNPENVEEIISAIQTMKTDKDFYTRMKSNLVKAKTELCWEHEKRVLERAFTAILNLPVDA